MCCYSGLTLVVVIFWVFFFLVVVVVDIGGRWLIMCGGW